MASFFTDRPGMPLPSAGTDDFVDIEKEGELKEVVSRTAVSVIFAMVNGRDAVNATSNEEFVE